MLFQFLQYFLVYSLYFYISLKQFSNKITFKRIIAYLLISPVFAFFISAFLATIFYRDNLVFTPLNCALNNAILFFVVFICTLIYKKLAQKNSIIGPFVYISLYMIWQLHTLPSSNIVDLIIFNVILPILIYMFYFLVICKQIKILNDKVKDDIVMKNRNILLVITPLLISFLFIINIIIGELVQYCGEIINFEVLVSIKTGNFFTLYILVAIVISMTYIVLKNCQQQIDVSNLNGSLLKNQEDIVYAFAKATEEKSGETGSHVKRVATYAACMYKYLGFDEHYVHEIYMASMLHDIGKISIPDSILHKNGKLTDEEFEVIKSHVTKGKELIKDFDSELLKKAQIITLQHHEKWNGTGYLGLKENEIDLAARVVGLCDVYDALGSKRSYKDGWDEGKIIEIISSEKGKQFDPQLVDLFLNIHDEILEIKNHFLILEND